MPKKKAKILNLDVFTRIITKNLSGTLSSFRRIIQENPLGCKLIYALYRLAFFGRKYSDKLE